MVGPHWKLYMYLAFRNVFSQKMDKFENISEQDLIFKVAQMFYIWKNKVMAIVLIRAIGLCNTFTKHKIKLRTWIQVIKWELLYSNITYRHLMYLIKSASTDIDHRTSYISYNNDFFFYISSNNNNVHSK